MAKEIDTFITCNYDCGEEETIKITIALAEYRSLISENARLEEQVKYLENCLIDERLKKGVDDG